jgi:hypothetical protein
MNLTRACLVKTGMDQIKRGRNFVGPTDGNILCAIVGGKKKKKKIYYPGNMDESLASNVGGAFQQSWGGGWAREQWEGHNSGIYWDY